MLALAVTAYAVERARDSAGPATGTRGGVGGAVGRGLGAAGGRDPVAIVLGALALILGALLFAGSLAAGGEESWPGLLAGVACALLAVVAATGLLERARQRLDSSAAALLTVWADAAALVLAGLAIAFPPAALLGLAALAYLLVAGRRPGDRKYQGLRVLR